MEKEEKDDEEEEEEEEEEGFALQSINPKPEGWGLRKTQRKPRCPTKKLQDLCAKHSEDELCLQPRSEGAFQTFGGRRMHMRCMSTDSIIRQCDGLTGSPGKSQKESQRTRES